MKKEIDKMYEQEPRTWYAKILVALIVAALLAWSMSTVQSGTTGGDGLTVAGKIISGIFHPDTTLLFNFTTSGVAYLLLETMCIAFLGTIVGAVLSIPLSFLPISFRDRSRWFSVCLLWRSAQFRHLCMD